VVGPGLLHLTRIKNPSLQSFKINYYILDQFNVNKFVIHFNWLRIQIYLYSQTGGPGWLVPLGRRDSLTANKDLANQNLPGPSNDLTGLKSAFAAQGLNTVDLVALSGIYTCNIF
jgi:hypothetical protein